ncbi:hypothetical protein ACFLUS_00205 [Chloroflexota bacterium]
MSTNCLFAAGAGVGVEAGVGKGGGSGAGAVAEHDPRISNTISSKIPVACILRIL